jgi:hypothetical protein
MPDRKAPLIAALSLASGQCAAGELLSVDVNADQLVRVDDVTGIITPVGPLGVNVGNVELAWSGGVLYMLSCGTGGFPIRLYELDPWTGAATALPPLSVPGRSIEVAEGLASDGTGLIAVFDLESGNSTRSGTFGRIDPATGRVTTLGHVPKRALLDGGDLDGLAYDPVADRFLGFDAEGRIGGGTAIGVTVPTSGATTGTSYIPADVAHGFIGHALIEGDTLIATTIDNLGWTAGSIVRAVRNGEGWTVTGVLPLGSTGRFHGTVRPGAACGAADLVPPIGLLDLADLTAFAQGFAVSDPLADMDGTGLFDLADLTLFVSAFTVGCP